MSSAPQLLPMTAPVPQQPVFPQLNGHNRSYGDSSLHSLSDGNTLPSTNNLAHLTPQLSNLPHPASPAPHQHLPSLSTTPFSLKSSFSPLPLDPFDPMFPMPAGNTPHGSFSTFAGPAQALIPAGVPGQADNLNQVNDEAEKDPFLTLLEQWAENEHSRGGRSELDCLLNTTAEG